MTQIIVLFGQPKDPKLFDEQYWKDHVPMVKAMPGLKKYTVHKIFGAPRGEPAFSQVGGLEFENMATLKKGLESPSERESGRHGIRIATGAITFPYAERKDA